MRILVIAPHADDEVLGCGGTIKKYTEAGDEVYLCIVTKTYVPDWSEEVIKEKRMEVNAASKILGIKETFFLDLPTAKLDTIPLKEIIDLISSLVNKIKPEVLYVPYKYDLNKDHRIVFESSMVVARPTSEQSIKKILCYEVLSETDWASPFFGKAFNPNVYIDISETLAEKIKAMSCYKTELRKYPHARSLEVATLLAQKRGSEVGLKKAEAFILLREKAE